MASLFPTDVDLESVSVDDSTTASSASAAGTVGRSFVFDYDQKKFIFNNGKLEETSKIKAIEQWVELYIRTEINKYKIYDENFGVDLRDLVSYRLPRGYQVAEIIRRINEGILTMCPNVVSVTDWQFDRGNFSFTLTTDTGEEVTISE